MGGRRRGNDGDFERDRGRPVDPEEARAHGNDPDAVEINRGGGRQGGEGGRGDFGGGEGRCRREEHEGAGYREERRDERLSGRDASGGAAGSGRGFSGREEGGASAGSRVRSYDQGRQRQEGGTELVSRRDSVRWGPIWAGLVAATG